MKKVLWIGLLFCLLLSFAGCGTEVQKRTVKFVSEETVVETLSVDEGEELALNDAVAAPVKPSDEEFDYTFKGWSLTEGGETLESYTVTGDVTFYAVFTATEKQPTAQYTVTFKNGTETVKTLSAGQGETLTLATAAGTTPQKPADDNYTYTFKGWSLTEGGETLESYVVTGDVTFYAVFTATEKQPAAQYTVTFKNGTETVKTLSAGQGETLTLATAAGTTPQKPADDNYTYTFKGWSLTEGGETLESYVVTGDVTFYAVFTATEKQPETKYSLRLHVLGETSDSAHIEGDALSLTAPSLPSFVVFEGWYTDGEFGTEATLTEMPANDVDLYAKCKLETGGALAEGEGFVYGSVNRVRIQGLASGEGLTYSYAWTDGAEGVYENASSVLLKDAGEYALSVTVTANYKGLSSTQKFEKTYTVAKKTVTATISVAKSYSYGATVSPRLDVSGLIAGDSAEALSATFTISGDHEVPQEGYLPAGKYTVSAQAGEWKNYAVGEIASVSFEVTKKVLDLTLTAENLTYGQTPAPVLAFTGFAAGEDSSAVTVPEEGAFVYSKGGVSFTASRFTAGSYTVSVDLGKLSAQNYTFRSAPTRFFKVEKATLTATVELDEESYTYGEKIAPKLVLSGFAYEDESAETLGKEPTFRYSGYGDPLPVGSYTVTGSLVNLENYLNVEATASFAIVKKELVVSLQNVNESYVYGTSPSPALHYEGFVTGDGAYLVQTSGKAFSYTKEGEPFTGSRYTVGNYTVSAEIAVLSSANYSFTASAPLSFTVTKAPLTVTVTMTETNLTYGALPVARVSRSAFAVLGETDAEVFGGSLRAVYLTQSGEEAQTFSAGSYKAVANYNKDTENYAVTANEVPFTIARRDLTVHLSGASAVYGEEFAISNPYVEGLIVGDEDKRTELLSMLKFYGAEGSEKKLLVKGAGGYAPEGNFLTVGAHALTAECEGELPDYSLHFVAAEITVTPRAFLISAQATHTRSTPWEYTPAFSGKDAEKFSIEGKLTLSTRDFDVYTVKSEDDLGKIVWETPLKITLKNGTVVTENFAISYDVKVTITASVFGITIPAEQALTIVYDKQEHPFAVQVSVDREDEGTFTPTVEYTVNGKAVSEVKVKEAGAYTVVCTVSGKNYETAKTQFTVNIEKAPTTINTDGIKKEYTYTGQMQTVTGTPTSENDEDAVYEFSGNTFTTVKEGEALTVTVTLGEGKNYQGATATFRIKVNKMKLEKLPEGVTLPQISEQVNGAGKTLASVELPDEKFAWKDGDAELRLGTQSYPAQYFQDRDNIEAFDVELSFATRKSIVTATVTGAEQDYVKSASGIALVILTLVDEEGAPCSEETREYLRLECNDSEVDWTVGSTYLVKWTLTLIENDYFELKMDETKSTTFKGTSVFKWRSVDVGGKFYTVEDALFLLESGKTATVKYNTAFAAQEIADMVYKDAAYRTVKQGATLLVPFSASDKGAADTSGAAFAAVTGSGYATLTLPAGELIVQGKLLVNAKRTSASNFTSTINGANFANLQLLQGTKVTVESGATYESVGFTYGAGEIVAKSGSSVYEPFGMPGWKGGKISLNIMSSGAFPLNQYTVNSIISKLKLEQGASYTLRACLAVSFLKLSADVKFAGSGKDFFLQLTSGYLMKWVDESNGKIHFELSGETVFNNLILDTGFYNVTTAGLQVPIPGNFAFTLKEGSATLPAGVQIKLLPGASFVTEQGTTFTLEQAIADGEDETKEPTRAALFAYGDQNYQLGGGLTAWQDGKFLDGYPSSHTRGSYRVKPAFDYGTKTPATVLIKGTLVVKEGAVLCATVTGETGAKLDLAAGIVTEKTIKEDFSVSNTPAVIDSTLSLGGGLSAGKYTYTDGSWKKD